VATTSRAVTPRPCLDAEVQPTLLSIAAAADWRRDLWLLGLERSRPEQSPAIPLAGPRTLLAVDFHPRPLTSHSSTTISTGYRPTLLVRDRDESSWAFPKALRRGQPDGCSSGLLALAAPRCLSDRSAGP